MAAASVKALNAKIRSNPVSNYICSTHFWGPVSNFGIPVAAILDMKKDPEIISGRMTAALTVYSGTFMRYALAVTPKNPLLFACHFINFGSQLTQGYRYVQYWHYGGREASLGQQVKTSGVNIEADGKALAADVKDSAEGLVGDAKQKAGEIKTKVVK